MVALSKKGRCGVNLRSEYVVKERICVTEAARLWAHTLTHNIKSGLTVTLCGCCGRIVLHVDICRKKKRYNGSDTQTAMPQGGNH